MVALLLSGCSAHKPVATCPVTIESPPPLKGKPTPAKVSALEIEVALWGEAERARGDCWMASAGVR